MDLWNSKIVEMQRKLSMTSITRRCLEKGSVWSMRMAAREREDMEVTDMVAVVEVVLEEVQGVEENMAPQ